MIKHQLKITVSDGGGELVDIAEIKRISLFKLLTKKWFGRTKKVMVIIPDESVQSVEIKEVEIKNDKQSNARKSRAV